MKANSTSIDRLRRARTPTPKPTVSARLKACLKARTTLPHSHHRLPASVAAAPSLWRCGCGHHVSFVSCATPASWLRMQKKGAALQARREGAVDRARTALASLVSPSFPMLVGLALPAAAAALLVPPAPSLVARAAAAPDGGTLEAAAAALNAPGVKLSYDGPVIDYDGSLRYPISGAEIVSPSGVLLLVGALVTSIWRAPARRRSGNEVRRPLAG